MTDPGTTDPQDDRPSPAGPHEAEPAPGGLRAARAHRTRAALQEAAFRLATERGYEATTIDDVAAAAGVSRRTVFNYFSSKADLFILGPQTPTQEAVETFVAAQGNLLDDLATLLATTVPATGPYDVHGTRFRQLRTILHDTPELLPELQERVRLHQSVVRAALARRLGLSLTDPRTTTASALAATLIKTSITLWAGDPDDDAHCPDQACHEASHTHSESSPASLAEAVDLVTTSLHELFGNDTAPRSERTNA
ncbi:TetR/AcrR family transcriptional regulator [Actinomyces urogenitalis]|uniref:TetR/AcrR family transcriptional regulator n=1 Tax=Actinomyces urogenitalis TaxID=103621 RepID=UPI002430A569|nr:TetR/AcrR family transcriptional regulator [Actinomyces urogenitalis]MCI7457381.1 TetR/AcrR family transcriptional regulator [Actinomyces urogenitalis]